MTGNLRENEGETRRKKKITSYNPQFFRGLPTKYRKGKELSSVVHTPRRSGKLANKPHFTSFVSPRKKRQRDERWIRGK